MIAATRDRNGILRLGVAALLFVLWVWVPAHGHNSSVSPDQCSACTWIRSTPSVPVSATQLQAPEATDLDVAPGTPRTLDAPLVFTSAPRAPPH